MKPKGEREPEREPNNLDKLRNYERKPKENHVQTEPTKDDQTKSQHPMQAEGCRQENHAGTLTMRQIYSPSLMNFIIYATSVPGP